MSLYNLTYARQNAFPPALIPASAIDLGIGHSSAVVAVNCSSRLKKETMGSSVFSTHFEATV